jgi:hypothetical protein
MKASAEDPIVDEMRAVRRELADRFGDDIDALCDFLAQEEQQHADRLVNRAPRTPEFVRVASTHRK